ncbi:MAG: AraC family transcriptional regulator, partial [Bacillota bacterium]|nr:AraC family transcriptional regulator [Bacillota bacterium]
MNFNTSYNKIETDENLMETVQHGSNSYPFHFYYDNLALFDFNCVEWHWHTELEFVYIESGTVTFWIGEKQFTLPEGNGVFINSKVLHRFYSPTEAVIPNFVCMPFFIAAQDSLIYHKYILPVISSSLSYQIFCAGIPWQAKALSIIKQIIAVQDCTSSGELATSSLLQMLWLEIYENADIKYTEDHTNDSASSQARLQLMMQYIHQNYMHDISLDDIAGHAGISKSTVLNLFRKYLHIAPINYLINYRLNEAAQLLSKTEQKINTVSYETGFNNVD